MITWNDVKYDYGVSHVLAIFQFLEPKFKDKVKPLEITVNYLKDLKKEFKQH